MSTVIPDPLQDFLAQDPTALVDPTILVEPELAQEEAVRSGPGKVTAAVGLGAAYLVYRTYMARRMKETVRAKGGDVDHKFLMAAASLIWNSFIPRWVSMTAPYLVAGYIEGIRAADAGDVPPELLRTIATSYAEELGNHINQVSADAVVSGFNAQVNRKVPPFLAAKRVSDAYGVPKRGMNALVNVWMSEEKARVSDRPLPSSKDERAKALISAQNVLRARQVGDNEEWAARTQAKQIVWMYGADKGVLPSTARRVWITADDERVCEVCGPLDGKAAPVGEQFKTSLGKFWTPPTHINCRCDVVLDLSVTGDIQDEITALLESETVTKAVGTDPYDRDPRGRFARNEGRSAKPFKEREAAVDEMLAQVNEALAAPVKLEPLKLEKPKLKLLQPLQSPKLLTPLKAPSATGTKTQIRNKLNISTREKIDLITRRPLPKGTFTPEKIRAEDIETDEGSWHYMDEVLTTVMDPYNHKDIGDKVLLDGRAQFYTEDTLVYDPAIKNLREAIGDYWEKWMEEEAEEFRLDQRDNGGTALYRDEGTDATWVVTEEAYVTMLADLINGTKPHHQEIVELEGILEHAGETLGITTGELAAGLGVDRKADDASPVLVQTKHGMPGVTEQINDQEWRNPGKWRIVNIREVGESETDYHHMGYTILEVEPADLFGDD